MRSVFSNGLGVQWSWDGASASVILLDTPDLLLPGFQDLICLRLVEAPLHDWEGEGGGRGEGRTRGQEKAALGPKAGGPQMREDVDIRTTGR